MAKTWADWYDAVLPSLPGLPTGAPADFFIRRGAIEFFDRSLAWHEAIADFNATAATPTYTLAAPVAGTLIVKVLEINFRGKPLLDKSPAWLKAYYGENVDWRTKTADPPLYWLSERPNQVRLVPFPVSTTANALDGWAAVKPTDDAANVPDEIWREYHDEVADLAKAFAMRVPKKPYTNPQEAQRLEDKVESRIGFIALQRARGGGNAPMRTHTHWI